MFNLGFNIFIFFKSGRGSIDSNHNSTRSNFNNICNSDGYGDSDEDSNENGDDNSNLISIL